VPAAIPTVLALIFYIRQIVKVRVAYTRVMEPAALRSNVPLNLKVPAAILTRLALTFNIRRNVKLMVAHTWAI